MLSLRKMKFLSFVYVLLGIAYVLLFLWFGAPHVMSLQFETLGPWELYGAVSLLFFGFAFFILAASFLCQLTAYGFLHSQDWARKLGIAVSLPPAIGTLPAAIFVAEIVSNWEYYDEIGVNPSFTIMRWAVVLILGLINSALVYSLMGARNTKENKDF